MYYLVLLISAALISAIPEISPDHPLLVKAGVATGGIFCMGSIIILKEK